MNASSTSAPTAFVNDVTLARSSYTDFKAPQGCGESDFIDHEEPIVRPGDGDPKNHPSTKASEWLPTARRLDI